MGCVKKNPPPAPEEDLDGDFLYKLRARELTYKDVQEMLIEVVKGPVTSDPGRWVKVQAAMPKLFDALDATGLADDAGGMVLALQLVTIRIMAAAEKAHCISLDPHGYERRRCPRCRRITLRPDRPPASPPAGYS